MPTRYEFGFGYGEIYRKRMRGQEAMRRQAERSVRNMSEEDRERLRYESDYYGFRGAGRRGSLESEFRVQSRSRRSLGPRRDYYGRGTEPRRWGGR